MPDAVPAGETVRAWLPFPRALPGQQEDIRLHRKHAGEAHDRAGVDTAAHCVPRAAAAQSGAATKFSIEYELTIFARTTDRADKVVPPTRDAELAPFIGERPPHIVFSDAIRKFSRDVVGEEKNPVSSCTEAVRRRRSHSMGGRARVLDDHQHQRLRAARRPCRLWSADAAADDVAALNGIPARWQSGWIFSDGDYNNMHDWGWLYLAPYGWVPMDVTSAG